MKNQYFVNSVDTNDFFTAKEREIHSELIKLRPIETKARRILQKITKRILGENVDVKKRLPNDTIEMLRLNTRYKKVEEIKLNLSKLVRGKEGELEAEFEANANLIRTLEDSSITYRNKTAVFDSILSRTLGIAENELTDSTMIVTTYYYPVLKSLIMNGYIYKNNLYRLFTASSGQLRTKKTVFIMDSLWEQYKDTLTCGLSIEKINEQGGININKMLVYIGLSASATDPWDFPIDKAIVVDDLETSIYTEVDHIDPNTYEVTRKWDNISINHTDGAGMVLPKLSKKSFQFRGAWLKGLLIPFSFDRFAKMNKKTKVTDIWNKEWDVIEDDIHIILTKSQFKAWSFFSSWQEYKDNYKEYNCQAGKCNEEEDTFPDAKIGYQMLQTLKDMSKKEIESLTSKTKRYIDEMGTNRETMLRVLGATEENNDKNYMQEALLLYPELLNDTYSKEVIKETRKSMIKEARSAKLHIDGAFTFICPDFYAFCQRLFLKHRNPQGLLKNGQVYCRLYRKEPELDCLRSPHLYFEHAIRDNVIDKKKDDWFITKGLYVSVKDSISRILQADFDGDKSLVCVEKSILQAAKRNMEGIVPLYYEMAKAEPVEVTNEAIYDGITAAFSGSNIGMASNLITKILASPKLKDIDRELVGQIVMENNYTIDYAKSGVKLKRPKHIKKKLKKFNNAKSPQFFKWTKEKEEHEVEANNNSVINRISNMFPDKKFKFDCDNLGKFNFKILMADGKTTISDKDQEIIDRYNEMTTKRHWELKRVMRQFKDENSSSVDKQKKLQIKYGADRFFREKIVDGQDINHVVDVLVRYLYKEKKGSKKATLWDCFGDVLIENIKDNLDKRKIDDTKLCQCCGARFKQEGKRQVYCTTCAEKVKREKAKARKEKWKEKNKV